MKRIILLMICSFVTTALLAQAPQAFKYQAIARDEAGNVLSIWDIGLRVSIIQKDTDGQAVYVETHKVQSNVYGLITIAIGEGTVTKGNFESISWGDNKYFIKMEMDVNGGQDYKEMGTTQLYAVPYALYAEHAGNLVKPEEKQVASAQNRPKSESKSTGSTRDVTSNSKFPADTSSYMNVNAGNLGIGTREPEEKLDVIGKIMASVGYNTNGDDGLSDTVNLVSHIDFDSLKLKYTTLAFSGGILTYISDTSAWVDTVGGNICPDTTFECGEILVDGRDGKQYATVLIGTQCWMAENLNIGSRIDGDEDPIEDENIEKYCCDDLESNCDTYGGLYQWDEAMDYSTTEGAQGICPDGWHIATDEEWKILEGTVDGLYGVGDPEWDDTGWRGSDAGENLKSTSGWESDGDGNDLYGFTALPGGTRDWDGSFTHLGRYAYFWSSTDYSSSDAWLRYLYCTHDDVHRYYYYKAYGFSVRCLKDYID